MTAILFGQAIAQGYIRSLDQSVADFIVEWRHSPRLDRIAIQQLLGKRSGRMWQLLSGDEQSLLLRASVHPWNDAILIKDYRASSDPGTCYAPSSADLIVPLIERVTKQKYRTYLSSALLKPIGGVGDTILARPARWPRRVWVAASCCRPRAGCKC